MVVEVTPIQKQMISLTAENERLRQALHDIALASPIWNGGVVPNRAREWRTLVADIQSIATEALCDTHR
jgi:hypothetical protein